MSYLESLNAVQGLAFIDASRPNPVRILKPQCWQNSHFEDEYVELNCVKSPEFYAVQKEKDIIFELLEGPPELMTLLNGPYRPAENLEHYNFHSVLGHASVRIYQKQKTGIFMIQEKKYYDDGYDYFFYSIRGLMNDIPIYAPAGSQFRSSLELFDGGKIFFPRYI